jgi:hypothetical protein
MRGIAGNLISGESSASGAITGLISLALILIVVFATTSPARADFEFPSPQTLSGPEEAADPQMIVDSQGRVTVVWQAISDTGEYRLVQAVRLGPDGVAGPVQTLASMLNAQYSQWCICPQLAVDVQDRVTVAWQAYEPPDLRIQALRLGADGSPGSVHTLSQAGEDARSQGLAVLPTDVVNTADRRPVSK